MADRSGLKAQLAKALDDMHVDVIHVGLFDYASMFRERRLRRDELLNGAETAVFANVLPK